MALNLSGIQLFQTFNIKKKKYETYFKNKISVYKSNAPSAGTDGASFNCIK